MGINTIEGFDHWYKYQDQGKKGWIWGFSQNLLPTSGRRGGGCLYVNQNDIAYKTVNGNPTSIVVGFALNAASGGSAQPIWIRETGSANHLELYWSTSTQKFTLKHGSGTVLGTSTGNYGAGLGWIYVELKCSIADSGGTAELRIGGVTEISFTGDTRNGGAGSISHVAFYPGGSGAGGMSGFFIDDLYILDGIGTPNDFLGDCRVDTLYPNASGSNSDFSYPAAGEHRYWRIYGVINLQGTLMSAAEIEMRASAGGADESSGGTASASSASNGAAANAFDNSTSTYWGTASNQVWPGPYIAYDFGAGVTKEIVEISYRLHASSLTTGGPTAFLVQYSDDGTNWTTSWGEVTTADWAGGEARVFTRPSAAYGIVDDRLALDDYISSSTANHISTFGMQDLSVLGSTIYGVQTVAMLAKDDTGPRNAAVVLKSSATTDVGASTVLGTGGVFITKAYATNPNGGAAWTESAVNAIEVGAKVTA